MLRNLRIFSYTAWILLFTFPCLGDEKGVQPGPQHTFTDVKIDPNKLLNDLEMRVEKLQSYTFTHIQQERFGDKMGPLLKMKVKCSTQGRVYVHMLEGPKKGAEILFAPQWNGGKAKVHKGSFPDLTLNLDPHGSLMLEDQHHPVEHLSFHYILGSILNDAKKLKLDSGASVKYSKNLKDPSGESIQIEIKSPWREKLEEVRKDEDLWSFSKRLQTDPYVILHANGLHEFDSISEGQSLKVPRYYASETHLTLNLKTLIPISLETYDGKGRLYEHYEWQDFDTETPLTDMDFDPSNSQYHF